MDSATIVATASAVISIIGAVISYHAVAEQRRVSKWISNYGRLIEAEKMMLDHPKLLILHGITTVMLKKARATPEEVVYLLLSFRAAQESYRLDPKGESILSPYRRQMLKSRKVVRIWKDVLCERMVFRTGFPKIVNDYLEMNAPDEDDEPEQSKPVTDA